MGGHVWNFKYKRKPVESLGVENYNNETKMY